MKRKQLTDHETRSMVRKRMYCSGSFAVSTFLSKEEFCPSEHPEIEVSFLCGDKIRISLDSNNVSVLELKEYVTKVTGLPLWQQKMFLLPDLELPTQEHKANPITPLADSHQVDHHSSVSLHIDDTHTWSQTGSCSVVLEDHQLVAAKVAGGGISRALGAWEITGKSYFEVQLQKNPFNKLIGVASVDESHNVVEMWVIDTNNSSQSHFKHGKLVSKVSLKHPSGYAPSDTVGVCVNTSAGSIQFFINGEQNGTGFQTGIDDRSYVACADMVMRGDSVRMLPNPTNPDHPLR